MNESTLWRFSLRYLVAAITVLCVGPFAWIARERWKSTKGAAAIESLEGKGALVVYYDDPSPRPDWLKPLLGDDRYRKICWVSLDPTSTDIGRDSDLVALQYLPNLSELALSGKNITDNGMLEIAHLSNLEQFDLSGTAVSDSGIQALSSLTRLRQLALDHTRVGDGGLSHLRNLHLKALSLSSTPTTDAGLKYLENMTTLESLNLANTSITDKGLERLYRLTSLRKLNITRTSHITRAGVDSLQAALPDLQIVDRFGRPDSKAESP